jgi:hypothetical protein
VIGLRLTNGRDVVVKVRAWQERLIGCGQVQHSLSLRGFPAPRLLVPPERLGQLGVSAEALISWRRITDGRVGFGGPLCRGPGCPGAHRPRSRDGEHTRAIACVGWLGSHSPEALAGAGRSRR